MRKKLYIKINKSCLLIAQIKPNSILEKVKSYNLNNREIYNNVIFNPSQIYTYIKNYLKENKIKKAKATICSPMLTQIPELKQNMLALQHILICGKTNISIEKIIQTCPVKKDPAMKTLKFLEKESSQQLDFFKKFRPPKKMSPYFWITTTAVGLILLITIAIAFQKNRQHKLSFLKTELITIAEKNKKLKEQIQNLHETQKSNKIKKSQLAKIKKSKQNQNNPKDILNAICANIPEKCWVKKLKISKKEFTIDGQSFNTQDILQFSSNLTRSQQIQKLKTKHIGKVKRKTGPKKSPIYSFKLSGNII